MEKHFTIITTTTTTIIVVKTMHWLNFEIKLSEMVFIKVNFITTIQQKIKIFKVRLVSAEQKFAFDCFIVRQITFIIFIINQVKIIIIKEAFIDHWKKNQTYGNYVTLNANVGVSECEYEMVIVKEFITIKQNFLSIIIVKVIIVVSLKFIDAISLILITTSIVH